MRYLNFIDLSSTHLSKEEHEYLDNELYHDLWCKRNRNGYGKSIHISQALHIFKDELYSMCYEHIKINDNVEHWKGILSQLEDKDKMEFNQKVERAKQVPIESLIPGQIKINKTVCPFHEDTTPSLHIYTHTNSYYCFVCHVGGDVIDYVQRLNNLDFKKAVDYLT